MYVRARSKGKRSTQSARYASCATPAIEFGSTYVILSEILVAFCNSFSIIPRNPFRLTRSRPQFIGYLYDSILFECSGQIPTGKTRRFTMDHLAGCFRPVREMYEENRGCQLDMPSDNYIRQKRLDNPNSSETTSSH